MDSHELEKLKIEMNESFGKIENLFDKIPTLKK